MGIVATSIARPVTVLMATIAILLFGAISLDRLGLSLLPPLTYPTLTVRTEFEGAAPAEVEEQITRLIEQRVGVINGVRQMHSISSAEQSDVILEFLWGTDMDLAAIEVREKLDLVRLPLDINRPSILRLNPNLDPIFRVALTRNDAAGETITGLQTLRRFSDDIIKRQLDPVPGVAAVIVGGGYEDEISVSVDQERLAALNITVGQLGHLLGSTNVNLSGGRLTDGNQEYLVRTLNEFQTVEDIADTIIFQSKGRSLRLRDVADVTAAQKERDSIMRVNGREAIEISMYKEGDANTVEVAGNVTRTIARITESLTDNFEIVTIYNQATFISAAIDEVQSAAILGALFAVMVLYLFLKDVRSTFIVAAVIPASVMATFALMSFQGITLNIMSLGGIALAVGMLMDNAIVVLENIARHRAEGKSRIEAAKNGASEVSGAVMAATATTIAVFLPLAFVEGVAGQLFRDQALTVTFAMVASLLVAFTLIPMLASLEGRSTIESNEIPPASGPAKLLGYLLRPILLGTSLIDRIIQPVLNGFDLAYQRIAIAYSKLLRLSLSKRVASLSVAGVAFGGSLAVLPLLPMELIPPLAQGAFRVNLELSPGTRLEVTDSELLNAQLPLRDFEGVDQTYSVAGTGGRLDASAVSGGDNLGEISVTLHPDVTGEFEDDTMAFVREFLADVPDAQFKVERPQLFTFSTPLEIQLFSTNLEDLSKISEQLELNLMRSSTFADVESSVRPGYPEIQIKFDQDRASSLGLRVPDIAERVASKVRGDTPTEFTLADKKVDIRLWLDQQSRDSIEDVKNILINPEADRQVRLSAVADVALGIGPADIQRIGQSRVAVVSANVANGDLASAADEVTEMLNDTALPAGMVTAIGGQNEEMEASFQSLQFALLLALIMVYLVMASLFESLRHPFVIMFTIPLAGVGAIAALILTQTSLSVVVFIGLILLVGIVVNNAIVLIDRVNQLRLAGFSKRDALIQGAEQRLRPILMTMLTTVLGLVPMVIGLGEASELRTPMAITVIGGLTVSTFLTLIVIPSVYDLLDQSGNASIEPDSTSDLSPSSSIPS